MLTGMYGDNLYWGSKEWLADLIVDRHFSELNQELIFLIKKYGLSNLYNSRVIQRTIKQLLLMIPGVKTFRRPPTSPKWLTPYSASFLADRSLKRDSEKQAAMLNLRDAAGNTREIFYTNRNGIEVRSPYHDRRLIEFVLGLPGYTLFSKGVTRRILRKAMDRILPVIVGSRPGKTNLLTFYNFGVQQQKLDLKNYYYNEDAIWRKYVKADIVLNEWQVKILPQTDGQIKVVPPLCLFYELWYKSLFTNEIRRSK
jgi:asparagine synthetase B (glutamine-hydrolysing)